MDPRGMFMERTDSLTRYEPVRLAGWSLAMLVLLSAALMLNCGGRNNMTGAGEGPSPAAQAPAVSLSPQTVQVALMGQTQFSATVNGSSAGVSWSVNGIQGGSSTFGTISNTGLYTAPNTLPSPNTVTVTATSSANPSQSASASVTILNPPPVLVSVSPTSVPLGSVSAKLTVDGTGFTPQSVVEVGRPHVYHRGTASLSRAANDGYKSQWTDPQSRSHTLPFNGRSLTSTGSRGG